MKILMIDDVKKPSDITDPNSEFYDSYEQNKSNVVTVARSGEEGLTLLVAHNYDLLLLDHDMGVDKMTGMGVIRWLESNPDRMPQRIYLITFNTVMGTIMMGHLQDWFKSGKILEYKWVHGN